MAAPRFEIVRTDAPQPWHARFRAANGRIVWVTENYGRQKAARRAIEVVVGGFLGHWIDTWWYPDRKAHGIAVVHRASSWEKRNGLVAEIRDVDERATS